MLVRNVAVKSINRIAKRTGEGRGIPAGSTSKKRGQKCPLRGARAFPSSLQAGPTYFIEKSKRRMLAEGDGRPLAGRGSPGGGAPISSRRYQKSTVCWRCGRHYPQIMISLQQHCASQLSIAGDELPIRDGDHGTTSPPHAGDS